MFPYLAADPGSTRFASRTYCVWSDGGGPNGERIYFSATSDHGESWSAPVVLSEQPMQEGADGEYSSFMPCVAVNPDGDIAVCWYDRRDLPKAVVVPTDLTTYSGAPVFKRQTDGWNVRLRVSLDGGESWLPSVQVNEQPGVGMIDVGHTMGISAGADGRFHVAWIDNRTGINQLWTSAVAANGN